MNKYYLLKSKYKSFGPGAILFCDGKSVTDLDTNDSIKFDKNDKVKMIEIDQGEAFYLKEQNIDKRLDVHNKKIYDDITSLDIGYKCCYIAGIPKLICTVTCKSLRNNQLTFEIKTETGVSLTVSPHQIEPLNQDTYATTTTLDSVSTDYCVINKEDIHNKLINGRYLHKDYNLTENKEDHNYNGKCVRVRDNPPIYGRVTFTMTIFNICMHGIIIYDDDCQIVNNRYNNIIFHNIINNKPCIMVLSSFVEIFNEKLKYVGGSNTIIDMNSVKIRERNDFIKFKMDDIVVYKSNKEQYFGRVTILEILNNIPCIGLVNSIEVSGDNEVRYIREDRFRVIQDQAGLSKYIDNTIFDPRSIATFTPSSDDALNIGDEVTFKSGKYKDSINGKILLIGLSNTIPSAIVELTGKISGTLYEHRINGILSFKHVCDTNNQITVIVPLKQLVYPNKGIFTCNDNLQILNPVRTGNVHKENNEDKMIIFKVNKAVMFARLMWIGRIDNQSVIGCEMTREYGHGTNGRFGNNELFKCPDKKGVLIPLDSITHCCVQYKSGSWFLKLAYNVIGVHHNLGSANDGRIIGSTICCAEKLVKYKNKPTFNLGERVCKKIDDKEIIGICRWMGLVNNVEAIGLEMLQCCDDYTDDYIDKLELFDCPVNRRALFLYEGFTRDSDLINGRYLKKDHNLTDFHEKHLYNGKLVRVTDDPPIYGRVIFTMTIFNKCMHGITIHGDDCQIDHDRYKDIIFYNKIKNEPYIIVVRSSFVDIFNDHLEYIQDSNTIIDMGSVKIMEKYDSLSFTKDDIVSYGSGDELSYGRIVRFELLNDIRCIGLVNSIEGRQDNEVKYVRKDKCSKIKDLANLTKYMDDVIINPRSIATFTQSSDGRLSIGDEVKFKLKWTKGKFKGKIIWIANANMVPSAVISLNIIPPLVDISKYRINDILSFKHVRGLQEVSSVIIPLTEISIVIPKLLLCPDNNIIFLNPVKVKSTTKSKSTDKIIVFKYNGNRIIARTIWIGTVKKETFIGCEMRNVSKYGTNGTFGDNKLFDCVIGRGVLIPLEKMEQCCLKYEFGDVISNFIGKVVGSHTQLKTKTNGVIVGSTISCAKSLGMLKDESSIKLGYRVRRIDSSGYIFGICRWIGLANNTEVIGVEMIQGCDADNDDDIDKLALFDCPADRTRALFLAKGFTIDFLSLYHCPLNDVFVADPACIESKSVEDVFNKRVICTINNKPVTMDIRWKGLVNDVRCVGCVLSNDCEYGTNGWFGDETLFDSPAGKGVLIPLDTISDSCENGSHKDALHNSYDAIKLEFVCCVETLTRMKKHPQLKIGSRIRYKQESQLHKIIGSCKWMGAVNGRESIGVNLKKDLTKDFKGRISIKDIFSCKDGRGVIFLCDDIVHDVDGEKLYFVEDRLVDVTKIWKIKEVKDNRWSIGGYVSTCIKRQNKEIKLNGELKWMGMINRVLCVGLDLEDEGKWGMNGVINDKYGFGCAPRHGVVTIIDNIQSAKPSLPLTEDGIIDARKYLKCEEKWIKKYLKERNVSKDGRVFVIISNKKDAGIWKMKGILRWCGTMNDVLVAVVELDKDTDNGSNGIFWRQRLIQCGDKRAIAVLWDNIHEYIPYEKKDIPEEKRIFPKIVINSSVVVYVPRNGMLTNLYGTVKWSGVNEFDEYLYGIELDDVYTDGTNGEFDGQKLFNCPNRLGILKPLNKIAPNERFTQLEVTDKDIPESEICAEAMYCIPVKSWVGENQGIQGNSNSCYFDSSIFALFSKSDVLDFMICPQFNEIERNEITKEFRSIMAEKIVYPLRQFGFVSFHRTQEMRNVIPRFGAKFEEMTREETDMENVAALLAKLSPENQLLRLTTFSSSKKIIKNDCMFLQFFVTLDKMMTYISSQGMLDISMAQNEIMFDEPPTCLIMQAPRDARGINCYQNVLPSRVIEISQLCLHSFKKCDACECEAVLLCKTCVADKLRVSKGLLCGVHKCSHQTIVSLQRSELNFESHVQMHLKAIICIEKAHFVAYVKEDEFKNQWVFFDSMSTQNIANNYSVPKVSSANAVTQFLAQDEEEMMQHLDNGVPNELKRIVKDSYIFVYHNTTKTCY